MLEARGIQRRYGNDFTLNVSELEVDRGEVLGLLGSSGSGKSTLIRILGLIEPPDKGEVRVDGKRATVGGKLRRRTATCLQSAPMFPGTVGDNVGYGLSVRSASAETRHRRVAEALAMVGLAGFESVPAAELSGGQAQRVALARVIALHPDVLILDEPLAHIDEPQREELAVAIRRFIATSSCAAVWVTHDRSEALAVSDRLGVIEGGELLQTGPAEKVYREPSDTKVARLVGNQNVLHGRVARAEAGIAIIDVGGASIEGATGSEPGDDVLVLVRPEDIGVYRDLPTAGPRNRIRMVVREVMAAEPFIRLVLEGPPTMTAVVTRPTFDDLAVSNGDVVWAAFKTTAVHVLRRG